MRLLIIEDELAIATALQKGLKKEGYAIDVATDGCDGIELLTLNQYDLVILDLNLPGLHGFSILEKLRSLTDKTRVIIVSANREIEDRIQGLDLGADDYLTKPFDLLELKARIRALLRREFATTSTILCAQGIEINLATHQVTYQNNPIKLTLKEYTILKYLMQRSGKTVSSEELLNHVWDENADPFSQVIRVHIYSLRKKIKQITGQELIHTKKGIGYSFGENNYD